MTTGAGTSGRQRVRQALAGRAAGRVATGPLAVHFCARQAGVSLRQYTTDAAILAECVARYWERFRPDAVWLSADTWVTAEAMGAEVAFTGDDQPLGGAGRPLVCSGGDVDRIPEPDPGSQGRWPLMLEAAARIRAALGDQALLVACFDQYPFSLACALMGIDQLMLRLVDDPALVTALMDRCAAYSVAYARALAREGAELLSGGDSPAGLLGPERYRQVALPFEQRVIGELRAATGLPVSLHICGDTRNLLADMRRSSADVLELDHQVDLGEAAGLVGPDVTLWGNLDPVSVLARGDGAKVRQATETALAAIAAARHPRFVLSSGCTLAVETPPENLAAMLETARAFRFIDATGAETDAAGPDAANSGTNRRGE